MQQLVFPYYLMVPTVVLSFALDASGQAVGRFVEPGLRGGEGAAFSYWDVFMPAPGQSGGNFNFPNEPSIGEGTLIQDGADTAFLTSSRAIYSFLEPTAFTVDYPGGAPVTNVIFQAQTGGTRLSTELVRLVYTPKGASEAVELEADFLARDDPGTGAFSERLMSGFQWDLTGLGVVEFAVTFDSPNSSMPVWQAQLDVVEDQGFVRELGYLLRKRTAPAVLSGIPGGIAVDLPAEAETRFFSEGDSFDVIAEPDEDWAVVGWVGEGGSVIPGVRLPVTFGEADVRVQAIFAPLDYAAWRFSFFSRGNSITGQEPDNINEEISGEQADPDGDGLVNLAEFAFGGNPLVPDSERTRVEIASVELEGEVYPTITYRRWETPDDESELVYSIRRGSSLNLGSAPEAAMEELDRQVQQDGTVVITLRSLVPLSSASRQFFQVRADVFEG